MKANNPKSAREVKVVNREERKRRSRVRARKQDERVRVKSVIRRKSVEVRVLGSERIKVEARVEGERGARADKRKRVKVEEEREVRAKKKKGVKAEEERGAKVENRREVRAGAEEMKRVTKVSSAKEVKKGVRKLPLQMESKKQMQAKI